MHRNLRSFISKLRQENELVEIDALVDPYLELAEIHRRVIESGGKALLFKNVKGSSFPVVTNMFGTAKRIDLAFGRKPQELVKRAVAAVEVLLPPKPKELWNYRDLALTALKLGTKKTGRAPVLESQQNPVDIEEIPLLQLWHEDGGHFVTLPLVYTENAVSQCDTIVVRYKREGTTTYNYIRMPYSNQTSTTINNLTAGARHSWRVKTVCGTTSCSYSSKKYFTPMNASELPHNELALRRLDDGTELESRELGTDLSVYPNPADYQVKLYFLAEEEANAQVDIFDLNGRNLLSQQVQSVEGDNFVMLETSQLLRGLYVVSVRTTDTFYSARLSVNH